MFGGYETFFGSGLSRESVEKLGGPLARRVEVREAVGSTQAVARELALDLLSAGEPYHGTLVVSGVQTGGRGRHGRSWGSPAGGLWMSVALSPETLGLAAEESARVTQAAAVGVAKALWEAGVEARIKWPNDLLVEPGGRKICGILAESVPGAAGPGGGSGGLILLGVGLNANLDPTDLGVESGQTEQTSEPAVSTVRSELGRDVDLLWLLSTVLTRLEHELYRTGSDFESVLDDWKALDCTLGERVRVHRVQSVRSGGREAVEETEGVAVDLTRKGALILDTRRGRVEVFEGEVRRLRLET